MTRKPLDALDRVLASVEAVRNGRALYTLLGAFSVGGLLLATAESALARDALTTGVVCGGAALTAAFYGANATGLLLMDEACGRPVREVDQALRDALASAHRLIGVLFVVVAMTAVLVGLVSAGLWAARLPWVGPAVLGLMVPVGVGTLGLTMLIAVTVVGPLAAPSVWSGRSVRQTLALLVRHARERLVFVALLVAAASALAAAVGALVTFAVLAGGRATAALAVLVAGIDLPPQQLMAGLFGYGLRSLGAAGAPVAQTPLGAAALTGGGVVFALSLVLPGLVYLRGMCAVYLAVEDASAP